MGNTKNDSVFQWLFQARVRPQTASFVASNWPKDVEKRKQNGGGRKKAILIKTDHLAAKLCSVFFLFSEQSLRPQARLVFSQPKQLKGFLNEGKIELE